MHRVDAFWNSSGVCRKLAKGEWRLDSPYRRIRATTNRCRRVNRSDDGWTARTTDYGRQPTVDDRLNHPERQVNRPYLVFPGMFDFWLQESEATWGL
ncbi:hypothetical protein B296_00040307 [Ensete ventricosum]|uniref:Uncharacterized protein n=1 Tax=Ensete ventricosum TaxID=4639 RepID=A0A426Y3F0_ENSVE|nr:hypothetical protein B296_00040307 [Ensete ventricosum]